MWHRVAPKLAQEFTLVIADLPGYGWSAAPPAQADHAPYYQARHGTGDGGSDGTLCFVRFRLAGHDRGGRVGYRLALDHPGRLEQLAVLDIVTDLGHVASHRCATCRARLALAVSGAAGAISRKLIGHRSEIFFDSRAAAGARRTERRLFDARALAHYHAAYQDPARIHAMCEDYRAGRTSDLEHDEADRAAGKKIGCPVLALWGAQGLPANAGLDPLACWRDWASDLRGSPIASGHYRARRKSGGDGAGILDFFNTGT